MHRKNKELTVSILTELIDLYWFVGLALSVTLATFTYIALEWALVNNSDLSTSIVQNITWIFYLAPIALFLLTIFFAIKTFFSYVRINNLIRE